MQDIDKPASKINSLISHIYDNFRTYHHFGVVLLRSFTLKQVSTCGAKVVTGVFFQTFQITLSQTIDVNSRFCIFIVACQWLWAFVIYFNNNNNNDNNNNKFSSLCVRQMEPLQKRTNSFTACCTMMRDRAMV